VNLNQIARVANAGDLKHIQSQAAEAIEEVRALIEELGQQ
jgi:signal transduction histidine kinase